MTMPDERLNALGEMRRLLLEISRPASHLGAFRIQLPLPWAARAKEVLEYYPTFVQMELATKLEISQRDWLNVETRQGQVDDPRMQRLDPELDGKTHRQAFDDSRELLVGMREDLEVKSLPYLDVLSFFPYVLRHFPEAWQIQIAARSNAPLTCWIRFDAKPDWWDERSERGIW